MIEASIINKNGQVLYECEDKIVDFLYCGEYSCGDKIIIKKRGTNYLAVQFDEYMAESIIYSESNQIEFEIPFGDFRRGYDPKAFSGDVHRIRAYEPNEEIKYGLRNIALNSHDIRGQKKYYPHACANFVTRDNVCFFERNAIDGVCVSDGHGAYPHHSWAGGAREDLDFYLEFGTYTEVEKVVFFLRADFPHDTYWKSLDVEFSDGTVKTMNFEKTAKGQALCLDAPLVTKSIHLTNFKQASYPLSWAALSQIEVYGRYLK